MANGINRVILIGNLGRKPELRQTSEGKSVCNLSLAINEGKSKDGKPLWVNVVVWEKTAEACVKYLEAGSSVYVEGRIQCRVFEKDGEKREKWEVVAHQVLFLDGKKPGSKSQRDDDGDQGSGHNEDWA